MKARMKAETKQRNKMITQEVNTAIDKNALMVDNDGNKITIKDLAKRNHSTQASLLSTIRTHGICWGRFGSRFYSIAEPKGMAFEPHFGTINGKEVCFNSHLPLI
jgi:hypothetical protein